MFKKLSNNFHENNKNLYIVGGFCRDKILSINESQSDIDFTTDALPDEVQNITKCI
jgi:tRNA nucleotidyltransferase/poly(A) polymerase